MKCCESKQEAIGTRVVVSQTFVRVSCRTIYQCPVCKKTQVR